MLLLAPAAPCAFATTIVVDHASGSDALCGTFTNIVNEDPRFCGLGGGDPTLMSTSPCLPAWNPEAVLIGAHGEGCVDPAVERATWGAIKAMHG